MTTSPRADRPPLRFGSGKPMPEWLSDTIHDAKDREREILARQAAVDAADGPDEREAAQARLVAYLDEIDEQDATDLARLGYVR